MIKNNKISIIFYFRMYVHSLINKFSRLLLIKEHLYPNPENFKLSTYEKISIEIANAETLLSRKFHLNIPLKKWQITAREKLIEIAGHKPIKTINDTVCPNKTICTDDYSREKIYLRVEKGLDIPVTVLKSRRPDKLKRGLVFLAGSLSGVHVGWGERKVPADNLVIGAGSTIPLEAVKRNITTFCIEMPGYGERQEKRLKPTSLDQKVDSFCLSLLTGRSLLGRQTSDVSTVFNWIRNNSDAFNIDPNNIVLFGHSTGGTIATYTGAVDENIPAVVASGSTGYIKDTIGRRRNSNGSSIVPNILNWFEMDDILSLIAPRPFFALAGDKDHIWPAEGAVKVLESAREQLKNIKWETEITMCSGKHRYYPKETWSCIEKAYEAISISKES
jgi:predicted esterase